MAFSLKSLKGIARIIKPNVEIGGLEVSDGRVVFLSINSETGKITQESLALEQGAVDGGKVKERELFIKTLNQLHNRITPIRSKKIPVVLSVSDADVYTQHFVLPVLQASSLKEAVRLNLQVISPIDFSKAYSDWQKVGDIQQVDHQIDILASFAERETIDGFCGALSESQFIPVAVEQKSASIVRMIVSDAASYDPKKSYFLLHISSDGMGFAIIKNSHLYFNRFTSWSSLVKGGGQSRQVTIKEFGDIISRESHQVINYYSSHFKDTAASFYIAAPGLEEQVKEVIKNQFSLAIEPLTLKRYSLDASWNVALGSALRGLTARALDADISLAPEGTETQFFHSQIISFASMWRNIILATLAIILAACVGTYIFLNFFVGKIVDDFNKTAVSYSAPYLNTLGAKANSFNRSIEQALLAKQQQTKWARILSDIIAQKGPAVYIDRLYAQSPTLPLIISGRADTSDDAIGFKNRLGSLSYVGNVDLPISSLVSSGNQTTFSMSFGINMSAVR